MALFDELGAGHVIHCGDVGGVRVFGELVGRPLTFVWGNADYETTDLLAYLEGAGIPVPVDVPTTLVLDGKRFAVYHGHEPGFQRAIDGLDVDYILHGHTHLPRDDTVDGRRVINPGALHRARRKTVATLDASTGVAVFHDLGEE